MIKKVKLIKDCKILPVVSVSEDANIVVVAKKIHQFQERRVIVTNRKKFPVGIISLVDINDRVVAKNANLKKTKAKDVMSCPIKLIADVKDSAIEMVKKMMALDNFYCPVIKNGKLKGLITYASIMEKGKKR